MVEDMAQVVIFTKYYLLSYSFRANYVNTENFSFLVRALRASQTYMFSITTFSTATVGPYRNSQSALDIDRDNRLPFGPLQP